MARIAKPWWRTERQSYFVTIRGTLHNLGSDKAEADREYHRLLSEKPAALPPKAATEPTVAEILDKYLDWCQQNRAKRTFDWYREHFQNFIDHLGGKAQLPAASLKPFHVIEWVSTRDDWGDNYRRGAIIGVQRPFNWAAKLGYIDQNPIRYIDKPAAKRRETFLSPEEWQTIRDHFPAEDPFGDILEFCWETGCRPQEAKAIEIRHIDLAQHRVIFPPEEAKGKKRWRAILLSDKAEAIVVRLLKAVTEGTLFLNSQGRPWTAYSMSCSFGRLKKHLGVKHFAYAFRHGFCQRMLESGVDHVTVAELMGHSNAVMVAKNYSHMNKATGHLRQALKQGGGA